MMYDTDTLFIIIILSFALMVYAIFVCINVHKTNQVNEVSSDYQNINHQKQFTNSRSRKIQTITGSWIIMLGVLFGAYVLGEKATALLIVCIGIKSIHEIIHITNTTQQNKPKINGIAHVLIICVLVMIGSLLHLNHLLSLDNQRSVLLFIIFIIQFNDINQYVAGTTLGHKIFKQKLAAQISPNKTIEGAIFGVVATGILAIPFGHLLTSLPTISCFFIAIILAITGLMGDLLQSSVKRNCNVKDMGKWIPGHGGIMDRVDSLILAVPIFYMLYYFV